MKLAVRIARGRSGVFRAWCPGLPGCVVWGQGLDETRRKAGRAVAGYLAHLDTALPRELYRLRRNGSSRRGR